MISIIVAVANNDVIGGDNALLWRIPDDLRRFKRLTMGHPIIMGRKTFESIGRALPGRANVVITRNPDYRAEGCTMVGSLEQALALHSNEALFVIGGGEIYAQALPLASRLYVTHVRGDYSGDTHFPQIDSAQWRIVSSEHHPAGSDFPHDYDYIDYERI